MDSIDLDGELPSDVYINQLTKEYHLPPKTGGLLDQPAGLIYRMNFLGSVHETLNRYRSLVGAEIHNLTIGERKIIRFLIDNQMLR